MPKSGGMTQQLLQRDYNGITASEASLSQFHIQL